jgi:hypothetical protein
MTTMIIDTVRIRIVHRTVLRVAQHCSQPIQCPGSHCTLEARLGGQCKGSRGQGPTVDWGARPSGREGVGVVCLGSVSRAGLGAGVLPGRHTLVLHVQVLGLLERGDLVVGTEAVQRPHEARLAA